MGFGMTRSLLQLKHCLCDVEVTLLRAAGCRQSGIFQNSTCRLLEGGPEDFQARVDTLKGRHYVYF